MTDAAPGAGEAPVAVGAAVDEKVRRFPCKQCGAELNFKPGTTNLICPYCGFQEAVPVTQEAIREYSLNDALLSLPRQQGWGTETKTIRCENCGATTTFAAAQVAGNCAFCGSSKIVDQTAREDLIQPESVVPFAIDRNQAVARFREWLRKLWFRPNALKQSGELAKIAGAYLPFWTFDAATSAWWTAEAGYYYYETETYQETDAQGNSVTKTRQVQKIRWEPASGQRSDLFDDELVAASRSLPEKLLRTVGPFQLAGLVRYEAAFLSGFLAEQYQVDLAEGWEQAKASIFAQVESRCAGDVPGDTHRNLSVDVAYSHETYKHILLPIWIAAYRYLDKTYRFVVNGQTGKVTGEAPISWWKIAGLTLLIVAIILIVMFFVNR